MFQVQFPVFSFQANGNMNGINDTVDFRTLKKALQTLNFSDQEQKDIFNIISAILHLGNVTFMEEEGHSTILKPDLVEDVSKVWQS